MKCRKKYTQKEINKQGIKVHKANLRWINKTKGALTEDVEKALQSYEKAKKKLELMRYCKKE